MEPIPSSTSDNSLQPDVFIEDQASPNQIHKRRENQNNNKEIQNNNKEIQNNNKEIQNNNKENIKETSPIQLPNNTPNSGGIFTVRFIDLVIFVLFLLLIGLLFKKFF